MSGRIDTASQQYDDRDRRQDAGQFGDSQRDEQPTASGVVGRKVEKGNDPPMVVVRHQGPVAPLPDTDVGESGAAVEEVLERSNHARPQQYHRTVSRISRIMPGGGSVTSSAVDATAVSCAAIC